MINKFVIFFCSLILSSGAFAQSKDVEFIVQFGPGGNSDKLARLIDASIDKNKYNTRFTYKLGAGGLIGATALASMTKPNEVGLMVASTALSISTVLDANAVKFSTKDFVLVKHLGQQSGIMVVGSGLGIKNFKDFVDYSKKNPVSYGSPGVGTIAQLSGEFVANFLKTNFVHVPYKGPPVTDVVSGLVTYTVESDAVVEPMIKAGRLIPIAVYGPVRLPDYPGVPTFKELGIDDFGASRWFAVIANKSADPNTLAYLRRLLDDPALNQELQKQYGLSPVSGVKSNFLEEDQKKYSNIIKKLEINK